MFEIDKYSRTPIYEQVIRQIELMILSGELRENDQVPSVRTLSQQLSVNPNTLQRAYMELERRGICRSAPGSGRYISKGAKEAIAQAGDELLSKLTELLGEIKLRGIDRAQVDQAVDSVFKDA